MLPVDRIENRTVGSPLQPVLLRSSSESSEFAVSSSKHFSGVNPRRVNPLRYPRSLKEPIGVVILQPCLSLVVQSNFENNAN